MGPAAGAFPCQLLGQQSREAPRNAGLAGLGEEGCPEGFRQEVCRHHTPIPVTSTAVAFKRIVQSMGSGRAVWGARSHGPAGMGIVRAHPFADESTAEDSLQPRQVVVGKQARAGQGEAARERHASCTAEVQLGDGVGSEGCPVLLAFSTLPSPGLSFGVSGGHET